ncbi:tRNA dihydrouridine synthase DusB [Martelella lutilitoris]|uniref:tRNA-dihydrouridine synthase n=1 Tax=Martelella lutilitoris TaxID=2583532 RepID=A0A5C4JPJ1_9HYPH|nr:tRNA dihydrouridine synthase DusB [Martelella lutilitoris]TNB47248.1 tRNA dihydrouridine synthase DusB [Martelella lutilitoris]
MCCMKDSHLPHPNPSDSFAIGNVRIRNRVILAPMSGVTDLPFRKLASRFGAGLVVTEMIASRELTFNTAESWARLRGAGLKPHVVQLAGRDPAYMAEAARIAEANGADIIDINMGCPAKKVVGGYTGSALMREPERALEIIEATVKAVSVPVTVKMRLGWDHDSMNARYLAARAEETGVKAITVHGRTRMQFYKGSADWDAVASVAEVVSVPFIANGDIENRGDVDNLLSRPGITAVMAGRACQGRPWHAGFLAGADELPHAFKIEIALEHYQDILSFYGKDVGVRHARKHLGWYLDRLAPDSQGVERAQIMTETNPDRVVTRLADLLTRAGGERKAA